MARPHSLSLQEYVLAWPQRPWPIDWAEAFGRAAPLALEIGFGNGAFLEVEARTHPERDHLGIELSWTAATHLFRRLARERLTNVRVLLGEAEALVRHLFAPRTLAEVFINHPCPWPKARHHERRLLTRAFLALLAERMQPGAPLTVVTDHAEYAAWLADELAATSALVSRHATAEVDAIEGRAPTKYQLRAMAAGLRIHYFQWQKRGPAGPPRPPEPLPPRPRELPMTTLTLRGARAEAEPLAGFHPLVFREEARGIPVVVRLEAAYRRLDRPIWLVEALVIEGTLSQPFGIDVIARGTELLLKPSLLGQPHPTHGVKRALWCLARWLTSRNPDLSVLNESLGLDEPATPWPPAG
jgi:tRNA (guanine-N7-)-methyltransferase